MRLIVTLRLINCYAECRYDECHYDECHYAECRYDECLRGALRYLVSRVEGNGLKNISRLSSLQIQ
jgi:hypothetical protein